MKNKKNKKTKKAKLSKGPYHYVRMDRLERYLSFHQCLVALHLDFQKNIHERLASAPVVHRFQRDHNEGPTNRNLEYHLGRIRYFMEVGCESPIRLEHLGGESVALLDGNHRYVAVKFRGDPFIPVDFHGSREILMWLMGLTH